MTTETRSGTKYVEQGNKPSNVKSTVLDPTTALTVKTMFTSPSAYDARVHRSDVDDVQLELPQICPSCTAAVGVRCPVAAKFNPESEIIWPPDEAAFESVLLTTGPSKLKSLRLVPTRDDPTARTRAADADFGTPVLQATVVTDVRADVLHAPSESPQISPWACGPGRHDAPILILSRNKRSIRPLPATWGHDRKEGCGSLQQTYR